MMEILLLSLFILLVGVYLFMEKITLNQKRARLQKIIFPLHWIAYLNQEVQLYRKLPPLLKKELHEQIKVFLTEKRFVGQNGLIITPEIKLTIAAQACILLLGDRQNKRNYFPYLKYLYIYPDHIEPKKNQYQKNSLLLGQSSVGNKSGHDGIISLSWSQICRESTLPNQGDNVILHEFAHQLDQEFGSATGMPRLPSLQESLIWGTIFAQEYKKHVHAITNRQPTVIDRYGATNPVEFFAVVTEAFFMKTRLLATYHPLLYQQLKKYYGVDPINWN